jgi:hypothetical protein
LHAVKVLSWIIFSGMGMKNVCDAKDATWADCYDNKCENAAAHCRTDLHLAHIGLTYSLAENGGQNRRLEDEAHDHDCRRVWMEPCPMLSSQHFRLVTLEVGDLLCRATTLGLIDERFVGMETIPTGFK